MRRQTRIATNTNIAVDKAVTQVLRDVPVTTLARTGVLYTVATSNPNAPAPTDEDGNVLEPTDYFRAGMRVGSAPVRGRR